MKVIDNSEETYVSKQTETYSASISMTKEVFNILVKGIYKNPYMALIREYICNARDGHIEAGHQEPIQVHLPTLLEPWFAVKDIGIGMSKEMVTTTFMCLGTSTKRESNELIGSKGIGSKSAFSTSDQFQVISNFSGVKSSYVVYMNKGIPDIAVVSELPTIERNGVEVKVAIDIDKIETVVASAKEFLSFFDFPVELNLDLEVKKPVFSYQEQIGDFNVGILAEHQLPYLQDVIVMGGVAYTSSWLKNKATENCVVAVPIGKVDISPGREYTEEVDNPEFISELEEAFTKAKENYYKEILSNIEGLTLSQVIKYYNQQTSQAKKIIHDHFYSKFHKVLDNKITVYAEHRKGWKWIFSGKQDNALISQILSDDAGIMVKDKSNQLKSRAELYCDSSKYNVIYAVNYDDEILMEPFFSEIVQMASDFSMQSDKPKEKKERKPRVALKGHVVHYLDSDGNLQKDRYSKEDFEDVEHYLIVESTQLAANTYTKKYGQISWVKRDLMKDFNLESLYLLTERQSPWAKNAKEFKVENQKHLEKELEKQLIEESTDYNDIVEHINFLRQVKSCSSRLKQKNGYNLPKWYTRLVPDVVEKVRERADKKEKDLYEAYEKEKSDLLLAAPVLKFIPKDHWTNPEVKTYIKSTGVK